MSETEPNHVEVKNGFGDIILIVPPVFHVPDDAIVPAAARLIGAKDAATGQVLPGVLAVTVNASAEATNVEITAKLSEIAVLDPSEPGRGFPARTVEDITAAVNANGGMDDIPWVRNLYRVVGFELGAQSTPFFDPEQFMQDVGDVKRALGIDDEEHEG